MIAKKEIFKEEDFLKTLGTILATYEEVAATRMARIRSSVLNSRDFLLEINAIFQQVKSSYKDKITLLMKQKKIKDPAKLTFIKRNGKTLHVFISANTGLYGDIIRETYNLFLDNVKAAPGDVAIVGRLGIELFRQSKLSLPFKSFDCPDDRLDDETLKNIVNYLVQYEKINVFYERFNNVISQSPIATNISGDPLPWEKAGPEAKYFFEPSLEKIMEFFEREILSSIFQQTILESELAKFASRMISLDLASEGIRQNLKGVILQKNRIRHQDENKKQLATFTTISLWKR